MNPRILLLLSLVPFGIPLIISIGAVVGIIPLSPGTSQDFRSSLPAPSRLYVVLWFGSGVPLTLY